MKNRYKITKLLAATSLISFSSAPTFAQDEQTFVLDEIVVTAQKREQSTQDVPISVNVMSGTMIGKAAITNIDGIVNLTPGLNSRSDGPTQTVFAVRGIGTNAFGVGVDASVGVFVDDVYLGHPVLANTSFFDVDRIEVVKGPQGTLFGRNTSAGAISVISKKPEIGETYIQGKIGYGNDGQILGEAIANFSTSDTGAIRIGAKYEERDGVFKNNSTGNELNNKDNLIIRASLNQDVSEVLNVKIMAEYMRDNSRWGVQFINSDDRNDIADEVYQGAREDQDVEAFRTALNISYDINDNLTLTSISSYTKITSVTTPGDFDVLALDADFNPTFTAGPDDLQIDLLPFREPGEFEFLSTELRLNGSFDNTEWFLGASYRDDTLSNDTSLVGMDNDHVGLLLAEAFCEDLLGAGDPICATKAEEHSPATVDASSWGIYGDVTYHASDVFHITVGGRYSKDNKAMDLVVTPNDGLFGALTGEALVKIIPGAAMASDSWTQFSPRVALSYDINDNGMIYASYSKGFKSGGFNSTLFDDGSGNLQSLSVEPETNNAFEVGFKSDLLDGRARINAAFFYSDYSNFQAEVQLGASFSIQNVADAEIKGFEVEATVLATENVQLQAAYAYIDTEVKSGVINGVDITGNSLPFAPKHALTAIGNYHVDTSLGEVNFQATYSYTSKQWASVLAEDNSHLFSDARGIVDLRLSLTSPDENWTVAVLGQNVFDKRYWKSSTDVLGDLFGAPLPIGIPNYGASYRVEVSFKF